MSEKILVLRTANMRVIDMLMQKIDKSAQIVCLAQASSVNELRDKYPWIKVVSLQENYFNYKSYCTKVKLIEKFDTVYIPSSTLGFFEFEEVFQIVGDLKHKRKIFFNCEGKLVVERNRRIWNIFAGFYANMVSIYYIHIGRKKKI